MRTLFLLFLTVLAAVKRTRRARLFAIAFFSLLLSPQVLAQSKRAFIVGVGEYSELTDLRKTVGDARGYAQTFEAQGFDVTQLVGTPDQADFIVAFDAFVRSIGANDEIVFVFSGHGWSDGSENYLSLSDAPRSVPEALLVARTIPLERKVMTELRRRSPKLTLAIIDACRDEQYDPLTRSSGALEKGMTRISATEGELILYSSGAGQTSLDRLSNNDPSPYSVFTRILLPKLSDTSRPLATIADETRSEVQRLAGTVSHRQRPEMMLGVSLGYCLSGTCRTGARDRAVSTNTSILNIESNLFLSAKSCADFDAYLDQYPNGKFVTFANDILASPRCNPTASTSSATSAISAKEASDATVAGRSAYTRKDYATAFREWTKACDGGNATGCTSLGVLYAKGYGVTLDYVRARTLYQKGCDGGNAGGCSNLGVLYEKGHGVTQDYVRARAAYQKGCDGGNARGCTSLGFLYWEGYGVTQDYVRARAAYQKGCDGGNARGCTSLGFLYWEGYGVTQDYVRARTLYQKGCDGGDAIGCSNLGGLYGFGYGVTQDYVRARTLYQKGCDGGNAGGCSSLGNLLYKGLGGSKDQSRGAELLRHACAGGDQWGCDKLEEYGLSR